MIHLLKTSGGGASAVTGDLIRLQYGNRNLHCLFTDTLIEDDDLYRFLLEWTARLYDEVPVADLVGMLEGMPPVWVDEEERAARLGALRAAAMERMPRMHWLAHGLNPWQLFFQKRMMGSSRVDPCSHSLKRQLSEDYIAGKWTPEEVTLYFGIRHHERHRFLGRWTTKNGEPVWKRGIFERLQPWQSASPLIDHPEIDGAATLRWIRQSGIAVPRLYLQGFSTNNCGGSCVKAGHASWELLLRVNRPYYLWWERKEQDFREMVGGDVSILTCRRGKKGKGRRPLTLREFRERVERGDAELAASLIGVDGCGGSCALPDEEDEQYTLDLMMGVA